VIDSGSAGSGFEPAKALIRWLPLPQPRVHPSPVRGLPFVTGGVGLKGVTPGGVLGGKNTIGRAECSIAPSPAFYAGQVSQMCICQRATWQWLTLSGAGPV
jgi:hypothetical protein